MGKNKIPIEKYENLMKNEKNVDFPLNNMGNLQKDEEMARAWGGGQTNKQTDKRTDKQTDKRTDK